MTKSIKFMFQTPKGVPPVRASTFRTTIAALAAIGLGALSACGSSQASTRAGAGDDVTTTTAEPVAEIPEIPEGVTLRIGDQLNQLATVLEAAGEDQDLPYTVEYSSFIGGPAMLQAFQGGAIDAGTVGSTPLIFAQAADQGITAVAGWANDKGHYGIVAAPGADGDDWSALEGKKVAYQRGTAGQAFLMQGLEKVGLTLADITTVDLIQTQVAQAIQAGQADFGVSVEPLTSSLITSTPGTRVIPSEQELTDRSSFIIASAEALADEGKAAALADYTSRLIRAWQYITANREEVAEAVYVGIFGLDPERALELAAEGGRVQLLTLPDDIAESQQHLADLYAAEGEIPAAVDVTAQFDGRFNEILTKAAGR